MLLHNGKEIKLQPLSYTYAPGDMCVAQVRVYIDDAHEDITVEIMNNKQKTAAVHEAVKLLYEGSEIVEDNVIEEPVFEKETIIAEE